jgi:CheY-like chemotaxis protein
MVMNRVVKKILVVDDAKDINQMISNFLRKKEFDVTSVHNGSEAIEAMKQKEFDLMLLDIIMPEQDGFDVLVYMQEENKKIPTIGISGGGMAISGDVALKAVQAQVDHILEKPFSPEKLMSVIDQIEGNDAQTNSNSKTA